jgi:post-segregation antitoxin (ccd killing protein)
MAHTKMSVTVPKELYDEIRKAATTQKTKVSHLVTEALAEKLKRIKEDVFVSEINRIFAEPDIASEQRKMAEDIATNVDIKELPW